MKQLIFLFIAVLTFSFANSQSIVSVSPEDGQVYSRLYKVIPVKVIVSGAKPRAVVFSIDPQGTIKVLRGKNKSFDDYYTEWSFNEYEENGVMHYVYEGTLSVEGIKLGDHTVRVDVHYPALNKIIESKESIITVQ